MNQVFEISSSDDAVADSRQENVDNGAVSSSQDVEEDVPYDSSFADYVQRIEYINNMEGPDRSHWWVDDRVVGGDYFQGEVLENVFNFESDSEDPAESDSEDDDVNEYIRRRFENYEPSFSPEPPSPPPDPPIVYISDSEDEV